MNMGFYLALQPDVGNTTAREKTVASTFAGVRMDDRTTPPRALGPKRAPP
jgi:hypothetical protein